MVKLDAPALTIGEVAGRTRISAATLRGWERRYGIPAPPRGPSGHRRYSELDCRVVTAIRHERLQGRPMADAIQRALGAVTITEPAVSPDVRRRVPELDMAVLPEAFVLAISRAVEHEARPPVGGGGGAGSRHSERPLLRAGCAHRSLAARNHLAAVLADSAVREPTDRRLRLPIPDGVAVTREWARLVDAPRWSACVLARQHDALAEGHRWCDELWSVDPAVTRDAVVVARALISCDAISDRGPDHHQHDLRNADPQRLEFATDLANRIMRDLLSAAHRTLANP